MSRKRQTVIWICKGSLLSLCGISLLRAERNVDPMQLWHYIMSEGNEKTGTEKILGLCSAKQAAKSKAGSQPQILSQAVKGSDVLKEVLLKGGRTKCVHSLY